jgi:cyclic pyranopterin phosphate synthase
VLSYEEILRVVRIGVELGIRKVRVTGGEPLVRRGVTEFIAHLAAIPHLKDLALTTNGLALGELAPGLFAAGLRRVNVSLDTLRADVFRRITRRDGLADVLRGIETAQRVGLNPVKVNVVLLRGVNEGEVLDFARFAQEHDLEVRFIEFMPSRADAWRTEDWVSSEEVLSTLRGHYDLQAQTMEEDESGPCRVFRLPGAGRVGVISAISEHFCGRCNRLRLTADGNLRGCLFSDTEIGLRDLLRQEGSDEAIADAFRHAVTHKPEGHKIGGPEAICGMPMSRIGG